MPLFNARELVAFPGGDNSSDTVIGGVHFNLTSLDHWNYTLFSNGTLSNGSKCILTFEPYTPALVHPNGSFVNVTWCYEPVKPIATRAAVGIGFAVAFGLALILTLVNLGKHGKRYLPAEKRFYPIGRRWQWYWASFVSATAFISLITNVDVDRYYLPELPIVLNVFFWFLMQQGAVAVVWEAVRHWGSWMERQLVDPNPFEFRQDDKRARFEFWLPLFFYFWLWMNFFLAIPRNWTKIEHQRYPEQTLTEALPTATDGRFKAASFCLLVCWLTIAASLRHSIKHYCPRNRGIINRLIGLVRYAPLRFLILMPLSLCLVAYQILCAFSFANSPLNISGDIAAMYAGGYAPSLLIILINAAWGFASPNEDRELIRQRRARGSRVDAELGLVRKPAWWRRARGDAPLPPGDEGVRERIARNVRELGGGRATARNIDHRVDLQEQLQQQQQKEEQQRRQQRDGDAVEMSSLRRAGSVTADDEDPAAARGAAYAGKSERRRTDRTVELAAGLLFPSGGLNNSSSTNTGVREVPPPYTEPAAGGGSSGRGRAGSRDAAPGTPGRSNSTETTNSISQPPQQIKSMLDV